MVLVFKWIVLSSFVLTLTASEICSKVEQYIKEEKAKINQEKEQLPKGKEYEREKEPMSLNAVAESFGDTQRIFESVAGSLNITELPEKEICKIERKLCGCAGFQTLVSECRTLVREPDCDRDAPYRTYDGTCNNLRHPSWGSLAAEHHRIFPANYQGLANPRKSVLGGDLPDARKLTLNLLRGRGQRSVEVSQMFMFFAQFISHDISDTVSYRVNGKTPPCCAKGSDIRYCDAVVFDENDPMNLTNNVSCGLFFRHAPYPTCSFSKRQHFNAVPVFLDLHPTYGRTEVEVNNLRANDGTGRLKFQKSEAGQLMLATVSEDDLFCRRDPQQCFLGGDGRINQHTTLMALHILFLREHNRMADELRVLNPQWDGERVYQVARKILIAKMECIVYKDFLPIFLGEDAMDRYKLRVGPRTTNHYDEEVIPNVSSEFTVLFRMHNIVGHRIAESGCARGNLSITFSNPTPIHKGCVGGYLSGSSAVPDQNYDHHMVREMTDVPLFNAKRIAFVGLDMASADIKRSRDHGMPPYVDFVDAWSRGRITISTFEDLKQLLDSRKVELLKQNYEHVRDVDAYVGMLMEEMVPGSVVGPTAFHVALHQFVRLKAGDRFFFENQGQPGSFTPEQIESIKDVTLSQMICDNMDDIDAMPVNAFRLQDKKNPIRRCQDFPKFNIDPWKRIL